MEISDRSKAAGSQLTGIQHQDHVDSSSLPSTRCVPNRRAHRLVVDLARCPPRPRQYLLSYDHRDLTVPAVYAKGKRVPDQFSPVVLE